MISFMSSVTICNDTVLIKLFEEVSEVESKAKIVRTKFML